MPKDNKIFASVVGMNDVLPNKSTNDSTQLTSNLFQYFENVVQDWTKQFGYQRIITPIVEQTDLFVRSIGEETDINEFVSSNDNVDVFIINENDDCKIKAMQYARELRNHANLKAEVFNSSSLSAKFKIDKQFKSAYNSCSKIILIIRENELKTKTITVKIVDVDNNSENNNSQFIISENELVKTMFNLLK